MTAMRVVHVLNSFHPLIGGAERQAAALAREQAARGYEVTIVTRRPPGLPARERLGPLTIHRLPAGRLGAAGFVAAGIAFLRPERRRLDIVHAHQARAPALLGLSLRALGGPPLVVKLAGGDVRELGHRERPGLRPGFRRGMRLQVLRRADAVVALTATMQQAIAGIGIPPDRIHLIPNGVDGEHFHPAGESDRRAARAALNLSPEAPVAVFAGRLERVKGPDLLIAAWKELDRNRLDHRGACLLLAGDGPEQATLKAQAGSDTGVRFLGPIADTALLYRAADVAVVPSRSEGLSNTLLEAMASGLAVVATAVGGNPEAVENGRTGLLVEPAPGPLAAAIASLLDEPGTRARMGQEAVTAVRARFELKATASAYEALYRRLATSRRGRPPLAESASASPSTAASMRA
jgi:glycosyltransferase involved in cell wall biosynthesis